jgi:hypothetical protein
MAEPSPPSLVETALASARLRALRLRLLPLHKAILDAERERYERLHGRIDSAQRALRLVLYDPWFAWLRPLADAIVQIDERLADLNAPVRADDVDLFVTQVRGLVQGNAAGAAFHEGYRRALQDVPDVVVAHGQLTALLNGRD